MQHFFSFASARRWYLALGLLVTAGAAQAQTAPTFAPVALYNMGGNPIGPQLVDINGDGFRDLLTANFNNSTLGVRLGTGTGTLGALTTFPCGGQPLRLAVGDVNSDGKLDAVLANYANSRVSVLLGNGTGGFGTATQFATGSIPFDVALSDLNGDGKLDAVTADFGSSRVGVLLGTGTGTFGAVVEYAAGGAANAVAVGDVSGDGELDVVVSNNNGSVGVLLGTGTGSLGTVTAYSLGTGSSRGVALGDLNRDGRPDIVAAGYSTAPVAVLLNTGAGAFGAASRYAGGTGDVIGVALGDVNGDGFLDAAVARNGRNAVEVLPGTGTGTLGTAASFTTDTSTPQDVAIGDLNSDGKLDLVAGEGSSAGTFTTAKVFLNTTVFAAPTLTSISPSSGPVGTSVTLTGTNLSSATAVRFFNGVAATFSVVNAATLTATVPTGATTGPVTVTTGGGTSNGVVFTVVTPPANDDCANAPLLTVAATCTPTAGTTVGATQSLAPINCGNFTGAADDDVWYKFVASAASQTVTVVASNSFDAVVDVRAGSCASSTNIGCADATVAGGTEVVRLSNLTPGSTYYVRVYSYDSAAGTFTICVTEPTTAAPTVTAPANNSITNGLPTFSGTALTGSTVTLYLAMGNGAPQAIGTTTATGGSFSFTSPTALSSGPYSVYATAQRSGQSVSQNSNPVSFTVDATAPTAVVSTTAGSPTSVSPIPFAVTFSEAVMGFAASDLAVTNGTVTGGTVSGSGPYSFSVTPTGTGTVTVSVLAGVVQDAVGNPNTASNSLSLQYTVPNQAPMIANQAFSVPASSPVGTVVGTVVATDPDAGQTLSYQITAGNLNGAFTFVGNQLRVANAAALTSTGTYALTVQVQDNGSPSLSSSATVTVTVTPVTQVLYRLNAGGPALNTSFGPFAADQYFSSSRLGATSNPIAGTTDDALYQTERFEGAFGYSLRVPNGTYQVVLHFAELYWTQPGQRVFDVRAENQLVLDNYDILRKVAPFTATTETFSVLVTDGVLNLDLSALASDGGRDAAKLSALEVLTSSSGPNQAPVIANQSFSVAEGSVAGTLVGTVVASDPDAGQTLSYALVAGNTDGAFAFVGNQLQVANAAAVRTAASPFTLTVRVTDDGNPALSATATVTVTVTPGMQVFYRLNAGGPAVNTMRGQFAADQFFSPSRTGANSGPIAGTTDDALYQTERFEGAFGYSLRVPNGTYQVVLHFAETYWTQRGQRVFDVRAENQLVLDNYDILKKVAPFTATMETFAVVVSDGVLNLDLSALAQDGGRDAAKLSALEVLAPAAALTRTALANQAVLSTASTGKLTARLEALPNPFAERVQVSFQLPQAEAYTLSVYDLAGRQLQQQTGAAVPAGAQQQVTLALGTYPVGVYLVRLTTDSGSQQVRVAKQ
ncbi:malectin domain-containing carbohydrate-binding protein [Hymenobacter crusticola]|uniref:malectin domain-containing carbohydrate-binding protein n=1 Tax=Hymenobacter crusticola TaxID=1770526 RepID=UPI000A3BB77F|nr:malectin domain-containing carbohydrate-binding protein [Hymenobacter crusticola]